MSDSPPAFKRWLAGIELFSPKGFLLRAAILAVFYGACTAAGLRENTTFLSGTEVISGWSASVIGGIVYLCAYFGFVLGTPILVVAAGLLWIWNRRDNGAAEGVPGERQ